MPAVTIYGASDDLVELDGAISEEFTPTNAREGMTLVFADGTIVDVHYGPGGTWHVHRSCIGRATFTKVREGVRGADPDEHGRPGYTDVATLDGDDVFWVVAAERAHVVYTERKEST